MKKLILFLLIVLIPCMDIIAKPKPRKPRVTSEVKQKKFLKAWVIVGIVIIGWSIQDAANEKKK